MTEQPSPEQLNRAIQDAYVNLGMLHRQAGELGEAKVAFQKAVDRNPEWVMPYLALGMTLADNDEFLEAEKALKQATTLVKADETETLATLYSGLGIALQKQEKHEEARKALEEALKYNTSDAETYNLLGETLYTLENYEKAAVHQTILKLAPEEAWTYGSIGWDYYMMGEFELAIERDRKAVDMDPEDAALHYNLALFNLVNGNAERAFEIYRQAIEVDSGLRVIEDAIKDIVKAQKRWSAMSQLQQGLDFLNEMKIKQAE